MPDATLMILEHRPETVAESCIVAASDRDARACTQPRPAG